MTKGLPPVCAKPLADGRRAPVLPDDGVVQAGTGRAVPEQHRLALVGDADGGGPLAAGRLAQHGDAGLPDFFRVVLHPAGFRVDLAKLALGLPQRRARAVEQDRAGGRGALVEGEQERARRHDGSELRALPAARRRGELLLERAADGVAVVDRVLDETRRAAVADTEGRAAAPVRRGRARRWSAARWQARSCRHRGGCVPRSCARRRGPRPPARLSGCPCAW